MILTSSMKEIYLSCQGNKIVSTQDIINFTEYLFGSLRKIENMVRIIYQLGLSKTSKKLSYYNENIKNCFFTKTWMQHQKGKRIEIEKPQ